MPMHGGSYDELTRREFIRAAALGVAAVVSGGLPAAFGAERVGLRPNVVYVFADQMRAHAMGCMGNPHVITPHLDRLAGEGLLLTDAISCAPVCSPYRAQLMTGRYPHTTGIIHNDIRMPDSEKVIAECFKDAGYTTGYVGKWHLNRTRMDPLDAKNRRGWDFWAVRNCSHKHFETKYWLNDSKEPTIEARWEPEAQTDLAIEFMKKNRKNPFCLMLSFGPPHNPYAAPEKYTAMYKKDLPRRPNVPKGAKSPLREYYGMITSLDECVGRIMKALSELGIEKNTILCFSSDHGDMLGSQGHALKQRPWEESINVPFIARYPDGIKAGQKRNWLFSSVDVMPTLLGLAGVAIPGGVQGLNHACLFTGKGGTPRKEVFLFNHRHGQGPGTSWRGIRTNDHVYAYHTHGEWVMYNLKEDPYELKNLVDDPAHAGTKEDLRDRLEAIRKDIGEDVKMEGKIPKPARTA